MALPPYRTIVLEIYVTNEGFCPSKVLVQTAFAVTSSYVLIILMVQQKSKAMLMLMVVISISDNFELTRLCAHKFYLPYDKLN